MSRWIPPILFAAAAVYVRSFNARSAAGDGPTRVLMFPFVDLVFPSAAGDPEAMGARSVQLLAAGALALGLLAIADTIRAARRRREEAEAEAADRSAAEAARPRR